MPDIGTANTVILTFDSANGDDVTSGVEVTSLSDGYCRLSIPALNFTSPLNDSYYCRLFGDCNNEGTIKTRNLRSSGISSP